MRILDGPITYLHEPTPREPYDLRMSERMRHARRETA